MFLNFVRDAYNNIKRNVLMSTASIASVVAALIIMGIILIIAINVSYIVKEVESNLEMKVYLNDDMTDQRVSEIGTYIQNNSHVTEMKYISKEEALEEFASWFDSSEETLLKGYAETGNPLPRSYVIKVDNADNLSEVYSSIMEYDGVMDVVYGKEYVSVLLKFNNLINTISLIVVAILSAVSLFTIYNTIKLTVYARRNDVEIMRYVGASNGYIKIPFIIEGSVLGLIGAIAAVLLLRGGYTMMIGLMQLNSVMPLSASLAPFNVVIYQITIYFILYGLIIGALGSYISVSKYLRITR